MLTPVRGCGIVSGHATGGLEMRRLGGLAALLTVMVGALVAATPAQAAISAACQSRSNTYLFWPLGHDARPVAGFEAFPVPHLELYRGKLSTRFPDAAADGYIDGLGSAGADKKCERGKSAFASGGVSQATTVTAQASIVCGFGVKVVHRLGKVRGGARIQTLRKGKPVVDARMKQTGSTIRYDKRYCQTMPAPN